MKTDVITVSSRGSQMETALAQVEKVAAYKGLSHKNTLHLRLLTEEMMGMMRSITGETKGWFWIEDEDNIFQLHLQVETRMTSAKRDELLAASTTGKNESARGLMGWLRDFFDRSADEDVAAVSSPLMMPDMYEHYSGTPSLDWEWSMTRYQEELAPRVQNQDKNALEAWDQMEKSVVSHVADEVKVAIRGQMTEMVIYKKIA